MSIRKEQSNKVCRILDDVLANRPTERDSLIIAVRKAFESLEQLGNSEQLPSAQPEPLTDQEQRIFLAAMGREEKVCKKVDEEWRDSREPYENSLVNVCREIERKVKKALWT